MSGTVPNQNQYDSRSVLHTDPIRNFKFVVKFYPTGLGNPPGSTTAFNTRYSDDASQGHAATKAHASLGFMSVSGLSVATEPIPYREGGDNTTPRKLPGQSNFSDITLTRGVVIGSHRNWQWMKNIFHAIQGGGNASARSTNAYYRFDAWIHVLHHPVNDKTGKVPPKLSFKVYNCWPSSLAYSDLDAGGNAVLIEQMTLTHEGWEALWAAGPTERQRPRRV